jgi:hypothetical protein
MRADVGVPVNLPVLRHQHGIVIAGGGHVHLIGGIA